jgi:Fe-S-cluster containining protein
MGEAISLKTTVKVFDRVVELEMTLPARPTRMQALLPVLRSVADSFVGIAVDRAAQSGRTISCRSGCSACCYQLIPVAEEEAREIAALVDGLPEPRRSEVRRRFVAARERLVAAGLHRDLAAPEGFGGRDPESAGLEYLALGIPCPFLEAERCSIYEERPIACREYLVTSPAERCAAPTRETIESVELATRVWNALARAGTEPGRRSVRWVPLIVAPEWAASHPDGSAKRPAPELLKSVFDQIAKKTPESPER